MKARVVYERNDGYDMQSGPYGYERVGFAIGDRVFWTGCTGSGMPGGGAYEAAKELAATVVERFNRHWDGVCGECHAAAARRCYAIADAMLEARKAGER